MIKSPAITGKDMPCSAQVYGAEICIVSPYTCANLGDLLARRGQLQESERLLRAALRSREKVLPPNHPDIFDGEAKLGAVLVQERRYAEAEPLLLSAYHGLEAVPMAKSAAKRLAVQKIVEMYTGWSQSTHDDKAKEAARWKAVEEAR